jgi:non-canonical (house-cleaning) NTP pyrophosphatase
MDFGSEEGAAAAAKGVVGDLAEERIHRRGLFAQALQKCFIPIAGH